MKRLLPLLLFVSTALPALAQLSPLTVDALMRDPKWIGVAPTGAFWSEDSRTIYFNWNPEKTAFDSLYALSLTSRTPRKVPRAERLQIPSPGTYNRARTQKLYEADGDIFLLDVRTGQKRQLTNTVETESSPTFTGDEFGAVFRRGSNLFMTHLVTGTVTQLTNFLPGKRDEKKPGEQEKLLKTEQLALFDVLRERKTNSKP